METKEEKKEECLTEAEQCEEAQQARLHLQTLGGWAEQRSSTIADEFIRLEVQIATLLFGFTSLFLNQFTPQHFSDFSAAGLFMMRLGFAFGIFSLLASLAFGLLYLKVNESFWDSILEQRVMRRLRWEMVVRKEMSYKEAKGFHDGAGLDRGAVITSPNWVWIMQTIFLFIGISILFTLAIIFLFSATSELASCAEKCV